VGWGGIPLKPKGLGLGSRHLWTSGNVGEAVPGVMTPSAWSLIQIFIGDTMPVPAMDGHPLIGNIGGHFYMNVSVRATLAATFGLNRARFAEANEQAFGRLPAGVEPPLVRVSRWASWSARPTPTRCSQGSARARATWPALGC